MWSDLTTIAGVGFVSCERCGAAVLVDPSDGQDGKAAMRQHVKYHEGLTEALTGP